MCSPTPLRREGLESLSSRPTTVEPSIIPRSKLNVVAGAAIFLFGTALVCVNHWDMHVRHIPLVSLSAGDWVFDAFVVVSTGLAAYVLPPLLKATILALYFALLISDIVEFGPCYHYGLLTDSYDVAHDIFFGALIFIVQTALLVVSGIAVLVRGASGKAA